MIYYVKKCLNKNTLKIDQNNDELNINMEKNNMIALMIEELNKLDKILAPNKFPFGAESRKRDLNVQNTCNILKENKNILN